MKKTVMMLIILLSCSSAFAQDMYLGSDGRLGIGTDTPAARLEAVGGTDEDAVVGSSSGTGAGVYGINDTSGNYGFLGDSGFGVYGYSVGGFAGYFDGDMRVTGSLTVDGVLTGEGIADITSVNTGSGLSGGAQSGDVFLEVVFGGTGLLDSAARSDHNHDTIYSPFIHAHSGMDITSGTVAENYIDPFITRDNEIMTLVLAADGAGSGLDADMFDGQDSSAFSPSGHDHNSLYYEMPHVDTLESRIQTLELQEETALIVNAAAVASEKTRSAEPELEMWIKAAQKAGTPEGQLTFFDTDGNGVVQPGSDLNNEMIAWNGVISTFVNMKYLMNLKSPWNDQIVLWGYGGFASTQTDCNTMAASSPGQITVCYSPDEMFMMRSVFVAAADNNGNIVYEKSVSGYSENDRIEYVHEVLSDAEPEILSWIRAAQKAGTSEGGLYEVDTNADGVADWSDMNNNALAAGGVVNTYYLKQQVLHKKSPWISYLDLWNYGGPAINQTDCDSRISPGQITVCYTPTEDNLIRTVFIAAADLDGNILHENSLSGASDTERRSLMTEIADGALPELGDWLTAVRKAGTPEGSLNEVDTNADGIIDSGDMTNDMLAVNGVVNQFVVSRTILNEKTPFNGYMDLWMNGFAANRTNCEAMAVPGQITVCYWPAEDQMVEAVFVVAKDMYNFTFYSKTVN